MLRLSKTATPVRRPFVPRSCHLCPPSPPRRRLCPPKRRGPRGAVITAAMEGSQKVATSVTQLQEAFGIEGSIDVVEGTGGLPKVILRHACGAAAEIYLFGACVTSWKQPSGNEVLYVRPDAVFDKSKPISGGIPICFPQFGPGALPQHGFARNLDWQLVSSSADPQPDDRDPRVELTLEDSEETREIYPHAFKVVYTVTLHGDHLCTEFRVVNTGDAVLSFTGALHGYFEVAHVSKARVTGLQGLKTLNKVPDPNNPTEGVMEDEVLTFPGHVDCVFLDAKDYVELDVGTGAAIAMSSKTWKDVVCWNPYMIMPDYYEKFVCVENACYGPQIVGPGESWIGETDYSIRDL